MNTGTQKNTRARAREGSTPAVPSPGPIQGELVDPTPPGLDLDAWQRLVDYRKAIKRPIRPASIPAAQRRLAEMGDQQAEAVELTIANGWQGVFPPKGAAKRHGRDGAVERTIANLEAWLDEGPV